MRRRWGPPGPAVGRTVLARAGALLAEGSGLLVALPLWAWWAVWKGGYPAAVWGPGLVYLVVATAVLAWSVPRGRASAPPTGTPRVARTLALAAIAALVVWSALSLLWASDQGAAWTGADRMTLLALSFALPILLPPSRRTLLAACVALPVIALVGGLSALGGAIGRPSSLVDGRLPGPAAYVNASGALFATGLLVAVVLAARRELSAGLRVAMIAVAGPLGALALMTQSRGVVAAAAATLALALAISQNRLRLLSVVALVAGGVAAAAPTLLHVRIAAHAGRPGPALHDARTAVVLLGLGLALLGWGLVAADRRVRPSAVAVGRIAMGARILLVIAVLAGAAAFAATEGDPVAWARGRWHDFKTPAYVQLETAGNRFGGRLGSNRYDYWRVAVDEAVAHPLTGAGVDNFAEPYLQRRHSLKGPAYAHGVFFEALADLGFPGLLLLVVFVGAAGTAVVGAARRGGPTRAGPEGAAAGVGASGVGAPRVVLAARAGPDGAAGLGGPRVVLPAVLPAAYLLIHGSADWLQAFPVLAVPALGLLGGAIGVSAGGGPDAAAAGSAAGSGGAGAGAGAPVVTGDAGARGVAAGGGVAPRGPRGRWWVGGWTATAVAVTLAALPVIVSAALVSRGAGRAASAPAAAMDDFARAARFDPLAAAPLLDEGIVAVQAGDRNRARRAFTQATGRDPDNWFPLFMTGLLDARAGQGAAALRELQDALRHDPRDPALRRAASAVGAGRAPDPRATMLRALAEPG